MVVVDAVELAVLIVLQLLTLHAPGGQEINLNPVHINSMRAGEGGDKNVLLTGAVHCVIAMTDGKLVNVTETCAEVRQQIDDVEKRR